MRKLLIALSVTVAACHSQPPTDVALTHQHDAAYQRQVQRLHAEEVTLRENTVQERGHTVQMLTLVVLNPRQDPAQPDTLRQQVRQLARLVVADLPRPDRYQVVNVQVTSKPGLFARRSPNDDGFQSFIYPIAGLR